MTTLSFRLDDELSQKLDLASRKLSKTKSAIMKESLVQYLSALIQKKPTPYELGKEFFGKYGSGRSDLATNRKQIIMEQLREKKLGRRRSSHRSIRSS